jgi:DNA-binding NtrC family response regulator
VALSESAQVIEARHIFPDRPQESDAAEPSSYEDAMRRFQARFLNETLEKNGWNVSETARRIGLARSHLNDLIRAHGLVRKR